jgi:RNA polymerase sigma-70 factor (ECF subfamily)
LEASYPRLVVAVALANGSLAAAEDAVQEALVRAWAKSERGDHIESLPAWVTTVALNLSRKTVRRLIVESKAKLNIRASQSGSLAPMTGEAVDVQRALAGLPRRQRETAVLRYVLEMDTREVADVLHLDEGTVKSHLSRARSKLVHALEAPDVEVSRDATA